MKITLVDGTVIDNLTLNGTNYVSETEVDESVLTDENLATMIITDDDENEETLTNMSFTQQIHYENFHGNTGYYLTFHPLSEIDILKAEYESEITDLQLALVEVCELILGGESDG